MAPNDVGSIVFTDDLKVPARAPRTWSRARWFLFAEKVIWKIQQFLRIPYLNIFSNLRLFDASLHCLPGSSVVYERNILFKFGIAMACKRLRIPYVLYFEADDVLEHDIMSKPLKGILRWHARRAAQYNLTTADRIICVSEPLKSHLTCEWKIPAEKIDVFPNVADIVRFSPDVEARSRIRKSLGEVTFKRC